MVEVYTDAHAHATGVKSYPRGVTTNSSSGIEDYSVYYPVFRAMEEEGMVLNLHGEVPSDHDKVRCTSAACFFYIDCECQSQRSSHQ
jgi:dihydroorotase